MNLQKRLGCLEETAEPVEVFRVPFEEKPIEVRRCPRALITGEVLEVLELAQARYLDKLDPREVRRLPNLLVAAVEWTERLLNRESSDGRS